jgi:hypothetical protein
MSKQSIAAVAAAFARLSEEDQAEALKKIQELSNASSWNKQNISEGMIKASRDLGPINTGACPYCGK